MPAQPIPFTNRQASGLEPLAGSAPLAMNIVTLSDGSVRRRPCVATAPDGYPALSVDASGINGLHVTESGKTYAVAVSGATRRIYRVDGGGVVDLFTVAGSEMSGSGRPVFAETELLLTLAAGDELQKIVISSDTSSRLGGSPPRGTHIVANASRLLANDVVVDRSKVRFSDIANGNTTFAGHEVWSVGIGTAGFFSAEARPDPVLALGENTNEVFVFGRSTLQVFSPDPSFTFAPVATREFGMGAANSLIKADQSFFWLDEKRRFVMSDGRSFEVLSDPIKQTLDNMAVFNDCFGYRVLIGPVDCMVWTFPTDGRTFSFQKGAGWSQWATLGNITNNWEAMRVLCHAQHVTTGSNLVGYSTGHIGEFRMDQSHDLGFVVPAHVETGYMNHGTDANKSCSAVRVALKRGQATGATGPQAWLKWRDRPGPWEGQIPLDLGGSADTEIVLPFYSLGVYRRRQWAFEFSGTEELVLVSAVEEYEVLE